LQQIRDKRFSRSDANDDGTIRQSEFGAGARTNDASVKADRIFAAFDSAGDGQLTKSELESGFEKMSSAMKSVLLGVQDVSPTGMSTDPTQNITLQFLDSLTSSASSLRTGFGASAQQSLFLALPGLQEQKPRAA
jgi:hypothetical protein